MDQNRYLKNNLPVFVLGGARSGTSILAGLLRKYLKISFGTESQFIIRFYKRLYSYGDLQHDHNLRQLLADIGEERCFKRWQKFGYQFNFNRIYARIDDKSYTGLLDAIFTDLAVHNNMQRWGDKTPDYIYDLGILHGLFPKARFIHIARDGRDVALSTLKVHFGAENIGVAALEWNKQMEIISRFKSIIAPIQFFEIRYEDFLEEPINTFMELAQFLDIDDCDGKIRNKIEKNIADELKRDNYFKWKSKLKMKDQIIFEKVNYQYLRYYNYPTVTDGNGKITIVDKLFWTIDNRIKQLGRLDTWMDNLYKLNLRLRHMKKSIQRIGSAKY